MERNKMIRLLRQDGYGAAADYILSLEKNMVTEYCANCENEIQMRQNVANETNPDMSEFGSIGLVQTSAAGLKRIW